MAWESYKPGNSSMHRALSGAGLARTRPDGNGNLMDEMRRKFGQGQQFPQAGGSKGVGQPMQPQKGTGQQFQPPKGVGQSFQPKGAGQPFGTPDGPVPDRFGQGTPFTGDPTQMTKGVGQQFTGMPQGQPQGGGIWSQLSPMDRAGLVMQLMQQMYGGRKF